MLLKTTYCSLWIENVLYGKHITRGDALGGKADLHKHFRGVEAVFSHVNLQVSDDVRGAEPC